MPILFWFFVQDLNVFFVNVNVLFNSLEALPFLPLGYYVRQTANKRGTGNENKREKSLAGKLNFESLGKIEFQLQLFAPKKCITRCPCRFWIKNPFLDHKPHLDHNTECPNKF